MHKWYVFVPISWVTTDFSTVDSLLLGCSVAMCMFIYGSSYHSHDFTLLFDLSIQFITCRLTHFTEHYIQKKTDLRNFSKNPQISHRTQNTILPRNLVEISYPFHPNAYLNNPIKTSLPCSNLITNTMKIPDIVWHRQSNLELVRLQIKAGIRVLTRNSSP